METQTKRDAARTCGGPSRRDLNNSFEAPLRILAAWGNGIAG